MELIEIVGCGLLHLCCYREVAARPVVLGRTSGDSRSESKAYLKDSIKDLNVMTRNDCEK